MCTTNQGIPTLFTFGYLLYEETNRTTYELHLQFLLFFNWDIMFCLIGTRVVLPWATFQQHVTWSVSNANNRPFMIITYQEVFTRPVSSHPVVFA